MVNDKKRTTSWRRALGLGLLFLLYGVYCTEPLTQVHPPGPGSSGVSVTMEGMASPDVQQQVVRRFHGVDCWGNPYDYTNVSRFRYQVRGMSLEVQERRSFTSINREIPYGWLGVQFRGFSFSGEVQRDTSDPSVYRDSLRWAEVSIQVGWYIALWKSASSGTEVYLVSVLHPRLEVIPRDSLLWVRPVFWLSLMPEVVFPRKHVRFAFSLVPPAAEGTFQFYPSLELSVEVHSLRNLWRYMSMVDGIPPSRPVGSIQGEGVAHLFFLHMIETGTEDTHVYTSRLPVLLRLGVTYHFPSHKKAKNGTTMHDFPNRP